MAVTSVAHLKMKTETFKHDQAPVIKTSSNYKFKERCLSHGQKLTKDILNLPDLQPRLYGTCSSIQMPPYTHTSQPLRHRHWHGRWEHWRHGQHLWGKEMSAPSWDQWWNRSVWMIRAVCDFNMKHLLLLTHNRKNFLLFRTSTISKCYITTYLIVDHHMYCAVCGVGRQVRKVERLINDPLACERSITVQQNRHHLCNHSTFYKHLTYRDINVYMWASLGLPSCPLCLHSRTAPL